MSDKDQLISDILQTIGKDPVGLVLELVDRVQQLETDLSALSLVLADKGELEEYPNPNNLTFENTI